MRTQSLAALVAFSIALPLQAWAVDIRETIRAAIKADDGFPPSLYTDEFVNAHKRADAKDGLAAEGGLTGEAGTGRIEVRSLHVVGSRVLADIFSKRDDAPPLRKTITFLIGPGGKIADVDTNTRGKLTANGPMQQMPTLLSRYRDVLGEKKVEASLDLGSRIAVHTQTYRFGDKTINHEGVPDFQRGEWYADYRKRVRVLGWNPVHERVDPATCGTEDQRCNRYPEVEACSGVAPANCRFRWWSGAKELVVSTVGEPPSVENAEVRLVRTDAQSQKSLPSDAQKSIQPTDIGAVTHSQKVEDARVSTQQSYTASPIAEFFPSGPHTRVTKIAISPGQSTGVIVAAQSQNQAIQPEPPPLLSRRSAQEFLANHDLASSAWAFGKAVAIAAALIFGACVISRRTMRPFHAHLSRLIGLNQAGHRAVLKIILNDFRHHFVLLQRYLSRPLIWKSMGRSITRAELFASSRSKKEWIAVVVIGVMMLAFQQTKTGRTVGSEAHYRRVCGESFASQYPNFRIGSDVNPNSVMGHILTDSGVEMRNGVLKIVFQQWAFGGSVYFTCMGGQDADVYTAQITSVPVDW